MAKIIEPDGFRLKSMASIRDGQSELSRTFMATEYCEPDDVEGDWWIAHEQAQAYFRTTRDLIAKRYGYYAYVEMMEVTTKREWRVEVFLDDAGFTALAAVSKGFCWDMETDEVDMVATDEFYTRWLNRSDLTDQDFERAKSIDHPELNRYKQMFVARKLTSVRDGKVWRKVEAA